jgi:hypothetical protein
VRVPGTIFSEKNIYENNAGCTRVLRITFSFDADAGCCFFLSIGEEMEKQ